MALTEGTPTHPCVWGQRINYLSACNTTKRLPVPYSLTVNPPPPPSPLMSSTLPSVSVSRGDISSCQSIFDQYFINIWSIQPAPVIYLYNCYHLHSRFIYSRVIFYFFHWIFGTDHVALSVTALSVLDDWFTWFSDYTQTLYPHVLGSHHKIWTYDTDTHYIGFSVAKRQNGQHVSRIKLLALDPGNRQGAEVSKQRS